MKNSFIIIVVLTVALFTVISASVRAHKDKNEKINELSRLVVTQHDQMRIMAYHQAVAQLERNIPLEERAELRAIEWEMMVSKRTDEILDDFYEEQDVRMSSQEAVGSFGSG